MFKYDVTDEVIINASTETVFNAIIEGYDKKASWWVPYLSSMLLKGNSIAEVDSLCKVTIHGLTPIKFITKTEEVKKNEMLKVIYTKGAFTGEGLWAIKSMGDKTLLSFRWCTNPNNKMIKFIAPFYPIAKSHSVVMQKGFANLKKKLEHKY